MVLVTVKHHDFLDIYLERFGGMKMQATETAKGVKKASVATTTMTIPATTNSVPAVPAPEKTKESAYNTKARSNSSAAMGGCSEAPSDGYVRAHHTQQQNEVFDFIQHHL